MLKKNVNNLKEQKSKTSFCASCIWLAVGGGAKKIRKLLIENNTLPAASIKWNMQFQNLNWKDIFWNCFKTSKDTQLQWFQAGLLHRILPTERFICKIKNSSNCSFCKNSMETLSHLVWECGVVNRFWNNLLNLIHEKCQHCVNFFFSLELILFGIARDIVTDKTMDLIILISKFYIYKCKLNETLPNIQTFLGQLKYRLQIEKIVADTNLTHETFENNWLIYKRLLELVISVHISVNMAICIYSYADLVNCKSSCVNV